MTDWKRVAHHYRQLLRAEVAVSKRISLAGIAVTRNLLATRAHMETLEAVLVLQNQELAALREQEPQTVTGT